MATSSIQGAEESPDMKFLIVILWGNLEEDWIQIDGILVSCE